jgi:hypothetical protein
MFSKALRMASTRPSLRALRLAGRVRRIDRHFLLVAANFDREVFACHVVLLLWCGIMIIKNN